MSKNQTNSPDWKYEEQREINEPSDTRLAVEELRALVRGMFVGIRSKWLAIRKL